MKPLLRLVVLMVVAGVIAAPIVRGVQHRARESRQIRFRLLAGALLGLAISAVVGLWLPRRVPETSGSPAPLVAVLLLWFLAGGIAFVSLAALVGAALGYSSKRG